MFNFRRGELIEHDGVTSILQMDASRFEGITLRVIGPDDQECGCFIFKPVASGYDVCLQTGTGEKRFPFVSWSNEGERIQDILPQYRDLLSSRAYRVLSGRRVSSLLVQEFKRLLRKAVAHDADPQPESRKRDEKFTSLYRLGFRMGPKTVAELSHVFLSAEADGIEGG